MVSNTGKGIVAQNRRLPEVPEVTPEDLRLYLQELNRFLQSYIWDKDFGAPESVPNSQLIDGSIEVDKFAPTDANKYLTTDGSGNPQWSDIPASSGDEKVGVTIDDTNPGYLNGKLVAGDGVSFSVGNPGGDETLTISTSSAIPQNVRNFIIQNSSGDSTNDITFDRVNSSLKSYFVTQDGTSTEKVKSLDSSGFTKQLDATWAQGDNAGGRAAGISLTASTTYFCFILFSADGTVVDYGFDTDREASNLLSTPAISSLGLVEWTYVGAVKTDGSSGILNGTWREIEGTSALEFVLNGNVTEFSGSVLATTGRTTKEVAAPIGVRPIFEFFATTATTSREVYVDLYDNELNKSFTVFSNSNYGGSFAANLLQKRFKVDSSGEVDYNFVIGTGFNGTLEWKTVGWEDYR